MTPLPQHVLDLFEQLGLSVGEDNSIMKNVKNRIIEMRSVPTAELQDNKGNWRLHPQRQRKAMKSILNEVGIADVLLAYYSERNGNALTLIDGHLRRSIGIDVWPTVILDVNDADADKLIAVLDPIAGLAEVSKSELDSLLSSIHASEPDLTDFLDSLKQDMVGASNLLSESDLIRQTLEETHPTLPAPQSAAQVEEDDVRVIQLVMNETEYQKVLATLKQAASVLGTSNVPETIIRLIETWDAE